MIDIYAEYKPILSLYGIKDIVNVGFKSPKACIDKVYVPKFI